VGEAGAIPTPAAFVQAVEDALSDYDVEILETPLSPHRLFELLKDKIKE
jgi:carbon-monoxide dehydrogenase large subunit